MKKQQQTTDVLRADNLCRFLRTSTGIAYPKESILNVLKH